MKAHRSALAGLASLGMALGSGCSTPAPPACSATEPNGCPSANAPTYSKDIAPIVHATCTACHSPGGPNPVPDLTTYAGLAGDESTAFSQVLSCRMPPEGAPALDDADRQTLLTWFGCGSPDD